MGYLTATKAYDPTENAPDALQEPGIERKTRKQKTVNIYYSNVVGYIYS